MRTLVVYDSLYGCTKAVAEAIGEAVPGEVEVRHVAAANGADLSGVQLLIVGAPTHGAKPSPPAQEFLDGIQPGALDGVKVAAFDTRMTNWFILLFGTAAPKIADALVDKGGELVGTPQGYSVSGGKGPLKDGEAERAALWARSLVAS
jgi:flavodoxin